MFLAPYMGKGFEKTTRKTIANGKTVETLIKNKPK